MFPEVTNYYIYFKRIEMIMLNSWVQTGERIRRCREEKGWTQEQLVAQIAYITGEPLKRQTIGGWENGKPVKKMEQLKAMSELFSCDVSYLLCECDGKRMANGIDRIGLSREAIDRLISENMMKNKSKENINTVISRLIENKLLLQCILSAVLTEYKTGYIQFSENKKLYVTADTLYNAEKNAVFSELMRFIDMIRKENNLPATKEITNI